MTTLTLICFATLLVVCGTNENGHCPEFTVVKTIHAKDMQQCGFRCMADRECEMASYNKYAKHDNCQFKKKTNPKDCKKSKKEKHNEYVKKVKEVSNTKKPTYFHGILPSFICLIPNLTLFKFSFNISFLHP